MYQKQSSTDLYRIASDFVGLSWVVLPLPTSKMSHNANPSLFLKNLRKQLPRHQNSTLIFRSYLSSHHTRVLITFLRGPAWACVNLRGVTCVDLRAWTCVDLRGPARTCVNMRERAWTCVDLCKHAWTCEFLRMMLHATPPSGKSFACQRSHLNLWNATDEKVGLAHCKHKVQSPEGGTKLDRALFLLGSNKFHWTVMSCIDYIQLHWILLSGTE